MPELLMMIYINCALGKFFYLFQTQEYTLISKPCSNYIPIDLSNQYHRRIRH